MDVTHIACGVDGCGHLVAIIDGYDQQRIGFEVALRGRAKEAERGMRLDHSVSFLCEGKAMC